MTVGLAVDKRCIFKGLDFSDDLAALSFLADQLKITGYVKDGYKDAILTREGKYPTGLPGGEINIAIPHADFHLVNTTTIAVGILNKPVLFHSMDNVAKEIPVQIIIMLAIKEPHGQIEMLQNIIGLIREPELLKKIIDAYSVDQIVAELQNKLN